MASSEVAPIFLLPDELLMEIFSYITFIPAKMNLEQVSRRFRYVSSQSPSWKGIHTLDMMIKCWRREQYNDLSHQLYKMKGNCNSQSVFLNGISVPFAKWPIAIQLLLERTYINELIIHCGNDIEIITSNYTVIPHVIELFEQYHHKMNCTLVELHFGHHKSPFSFWELLSEFTFWNIKPLKSIYLQLAERQFGSILIKSLQISIPYLSEFVLEINGGMILNGIQSPILTYCVSEMWPIIKQCNSLNSITYCGCSSLPVDLKALIGKPLTKVEIFSQLDKSTNNGTDDLIQVINGATGSGVETLSLYEFESSPTDFNYFCNGLSEKARNKLKFLNKAEMEPTEIENLYLVPSIFPNVEKIEIANWLADGWLEQNGNFVLDEFYTMVVSFLTSAQFESSSCKMVVRSLYMETNEDEFKPNLVNACQNAGINVDFGEWPRDVILSKGSAAIIITEVECNA